MAVPMIDEAMKRVYFLGGMVCLDFLKFTADEENQCINVFHRDGENIQLGIPDFILDADEDTGNWVSIDTHADDDPAHPEWYQGQLCEPQDDVLKALLHIVFNLANVHIKEAQKAVL